MFEFLMFILKFCFYVGCVNVYLFTYVLYVQRWRHLIVRFFILFLYSGRAAKTCFYAAKPHEQKQLRHSRNNKLI